MTFRARRSQQSCGSWHSFVLFCGFLSICHQTVHGETIHLPGASGSGPYQVISEWATAFGALYPEARITVSSVGSSAAQAALWGEVDCENRPVQEICDPVLQEEGAVALESTIWGIGDSPIKDLVYEEHPDLKLQQLPVMAGAVVVTYSKDVVGGIGSKVETQNLNFTYDVLANIFNATLEYWDDPSIVEINPAVDLPHETIKLVVRADGSGQSNIFTESLDFNVPSWPDEAVGQRPEWPVDISMGIEDFQMTCSANEVVSNETLHYTANGKEQIALGQLRIPYSISYMEAGYYASLSNFLEDGHLSNAAYPNTFQEASKEGIRASMNSLYDEFDKEKLDVNLAKVSANGTYPASGWGYWYISLDHNIFESCYQAWLVQRFIHWSYTNEQAESIALQNGWITPSENVRDLALERLNQMVCEKKPAEIILVSDYVPPGYEMDLNHLGSIRYIAYGMSGIIMATSVGFGVWVFLNRSERVIRASQPFFLIMVCFGTLVMGSAIIPVTIDDSVASPSGCDLACMSFVWLVPCGFSIAFSALFSKIWRLNILIESAINFKRLKVKSRDVITPFVIVFGANVMILIAWTFTDPLKWTRIEIDEYNSYGVCRSENNAWKSFLGAIVFVNLLALLGANFEAYKARKIADEFSESKYIAFSMVSLLQALLLGVPLATLVDSFPAARTFTYTGIIFVANMSLLLLIFVPKVLFRRRRREAAGSDNTTSHSDRKPGLRVRHIGDTTYGSQGGDQNSQAAVYSMPVSHGFSPLRPLSNFSSISAHSYTHGQPTIAKTALPTRPLSESELQGNPAALSAIAELQSRRALTEIEESYDNTEKVKGSAMGETQEACNGEVAREIPPPRLSLSEGSSTAYMVDAAGEVIRLSRVEGEEKDTLSSSFSTRASFASSSADPPCIMVKVEDLPPEMANWYFRNFHT